MEKVPYSSLKTLMLAKSLYWQYVEFSTHYNVYLIDGLFSLVARVNKDGGEDQVDFETNYKAGANQSYNSLGIDGVQRLNVSGTVNVSTVPYNVSVPKNAFLLNGSSSEMAVNGSSTPVEFSFTPASGETWVLSSLSILIMDSGLTLYSYFGAINSGLTNGLQLILGINGNTYEIANVKNNAELVLTFSSDSTIMPPSGFLEVGDAYMGTFKFSAPILLSNSTGDFIKIKVRDNLTGLTTLMAKAMLHRSL